MERSFHSYRDLHVWQRAMKLAGEVYRETANFPGEEKFGLVSQMRRAAVSIPSNLAEGHSRVGAGEFQRGVSIAMGSVAELETKIILSAELEFMGKTSRKELLGELDALGKMLRGLQKSLSQRRAADKEGRAPIRGSGMRVASIPQGGASASSL